MIYLVNWFCSARTDTGVVGSDPFMFLFLRGSFFSLPENNSLWARISGTMAGTVLSDNTTENLAAWLSEKVLARKIITSHHAHPSCRGQRLFWMKDDVSFPLKTFQCLLIIFGIKSKLLNLAFACSPGLSHHTLPCRPSWSSDINHSCLGPFAVTTIPLFFLCQTWHFLALRSLLKCHFLNPDYSISPCLFLPHDPILLLWYFSYLSPYFCLSH